MPPSISNHIRDSTAAAHCRHWRWRVIGPCSVPHLQPSNLDILGWVRDPTREIANATLVVGAAGDGLIGSILAADRPFVCIPEDRPFNEQRVSAHQLAALGAAVVLSQWPDPARWPGLIAEALALPSCVRRGLHDPTGAHAAASWICRMADTSHQAWERAA